MKLKNTYSIENYCVHVLINISFWDYTKLILSLLLLLLIWPCRVTFTHPLFFMVLVLSLTRLFPRVIHRHSWIFIPGKKSTHYQYMCVLSDIDEIYRGRLWMYESGVGSKNHSTCRPEFSNLDASRGLEGNINWLNRQV